MFSEHWRSRLFSVWLALVAVLMVLVLPLPARAETPVAWVTLYEVDEALKFKPRGHSAEAVIARLAQASLLGGPTDVSAAPDTSSVFQTGMYVKADARSNVSLSTLRGSVQGTIQLLTDMESERLSLDTLLVTGVLDIRGELDLTTAAKTATAPITGRWRAEHSRDRGTFTGIFLIPFAYGGGYYYINPARVASGFKCKVAGFDESPVC